MSPYCSGSFLPETIYFVPVQVQIILHELSLNYFTTSKIFFYMTTLNLARFLIEDAPQFKEDEQDIQVMSAIEAWKHSDFLYRNYVLNGLIDTLYNVYYTKSSTKELWESLDRKYKTEDAGAKKFIVGRLLDFKMVDSKTVINKVQEL